MQVERKRPAQPALADGVCGVCHVWYLAASVHCKRLCLLRRQVLASGAVARQAR